jgi:serine/threonine protein phosphatase PrpC
VNAPFAVPAVERNAWHLKPFRFRSIACTHAGCVRKLNEDACLDRADIGLWAVADGMGGHDAGDVASATVIDALARVSDFGSAFAFRRAVRTALMEANSQLQQLADDELLGPIGSTVVTLLAHRGHYACFWAGDSRAYVRRSDKLARITRDHSLVQELVDVGEIEDAEAKGHRNANVVTRAVGAQARLELDGNYGRIEPGDRFLLCSDGLAAVLSDGDIAAHLATSSVPVAVHGLMKTALERGAPDNVTFVLIDAERD